MTAEAYAHARRWLASRPFIEKGRRHRYELFAAKCLNSREDSVLDVGSGSGTLIERYNHENPITAIDLLDHTAHFVNRPNVRFVQADATRIPFPDNSFDVAFSNSVVEHLPLVLREAYAREIRRVSSRYFVQTPNRHFPIEPHYWLPLAQYTPKFVQDWLAARFNDGEEIHLLTAQELQALFPDAAIVRERFLGVAKSLIAIATTR